jgi:hypothetical protein
MATIKMSGKTFQLDDSIANDDTQLRRALSTLYPDAANAEITRETRDGQLIVHIIKRAGPKGLMAAPRAPDEPVGGSSPRPPADGRICDSLEERQAAVVQLLIEAPEVVNPACAIAWELQVLEAQGALRIRDLAAMRERVLDAITAGDRMAERVARTLYQLQQATPTPSRISDSVL